MGANGEQPDSERPPLGWSWRMPPGPWSTVLVLLPIFFGTAFGIAVAILLPWLYWLRELARGL